METKPTPSVAQTLIANLYERQTGYRPEFYNMAHDGENIHVWGDVRDLPAGYCQIGNIKLYQAEPSGRQEVVDNSRLEAVIYPARWFDVFPLASLTGIRGYDTYKLPDGKF